MRGEGQIEVGGLMVAIYSIQCIKNRRIHVHVAGSMPSSNLPNNIYYYMIYFTFPDLLKRGHKLFLKIDWLAAKKSVKKSVNQVFRKIYWNFNWKPSHWIKDTIQYWTFWFSQSWIILLQYCEKKKKINKSKNFTFYGYR